MIHLVSEANLGSHVAIRSDGLKAMGHPEIRIRFNDAKLMLEAEQFLRYVCDYIGTTGRQIGPGETMAYGYWLTKFQAAKSNILEVWEYDSQATHFIEGASLTLRYWKDQRAICERFGAAFEPPRPDNLTVVSKGVLEGLPVQAVRYPSPPHMSGWWIVTEQYDGNIANLRHEHSYHVTAARPDLVKYLALPYRFRFDLSSGEVVWFDEQIEDDQPDASADCEE